MSKPTMPKGSRGRKKKPHEVEPWYKRYPRDWFEDTRDLKLDERGAYNDIIDLIYMTGGPIRDDARALAFRLHCDARVWTRIRRRLLAEGFLYIVHEATCGKLMNKRCAEVLAERQLQLAYMGRSGEPSPEVPPDLFGNPNEINGGMASRSTDSDSDSEREKESSTTPLRVIPGGRAQRRVSQEALDEAAELYRLAGLHIDQDKLKTLEADFWAWPKSAEARYVDASFKGFAGRKASDLAKARKRS